MRRDILSPVERRETVCPSGLSAQLTGGGKWHILEVTSKICYRIVEERLLASVIVNILEEILLITLSVTHLTEDLTVLADDTLNRVV